jgi:hypothetical protein
MLVEAATRLASATPGAQPPAAIEVFDTFGPGHPTVEDDVEAAMWNNEYQVWVGEFRDGIN